MAWRGSVWLGKVGEEWSGEVGLAQAGYGEVRIGVARRALAWMGMERRGRPGEVGEGWARHGRRGALWQAEARRVEAWLGQARRGRSGMVRPG